MSPRGMFIALEGLNCAGKTSQVHTVEQALRKYGGKDHRHTVYIKNPEGAPDSILKPLLEAAGKLPTAVDPFLLGGLYGLNHYMLWEKIRSYLFDGVHVVVVRWLPSTFVYQGGELVGSPTLEHRLHILQDFLKALRVGNPDLYVHFGADYREYLARWSARQKESPRLVPPMDEETFRIRDARYEVFQETWEPCAPRCVIETSDRSWQQVADTVTECVRIHMDMWRKRVKP